jgi:hypothetical protein
MTPVLPFEIRTRPYKRTFIPRRGKQKRKEHIPHCSIEMALDEENSNVRRSRLWHLAKGRAVLGNHCGKSLAHGWPTSRRGRLQCMRKQQRSHLRSISGGLRSYSGLAHCTQSTLSIRLPAALWCTGMHGIHSQQAHHCL